VTSSWHFGGRFTCRDHLLNQVIEKWEDVIDTVLTNRSWKSKLGCGWAPSRPAYLWNWAWLMVSITSPSHPSFAFDRPRGVNRWYWVTHLQHVQVQLLLSTIGFRHKRSHTAVRSLDSWWMGICPKALSGQDLQPALRVCRLHSLPGFKSPSCAIVATHNTTTHSPQCGQGFEKSDYNDILWNTAWCRR